MPTRPVCLSLAVLAVWAVPMPTAAPADAPPAKPQPRAARIVAGKDRVDFFAGDELVTRYHVGPDAAKPYLWPLLAPGGTPVTRAWPMDKSVPGEATDHVHQKSAWFCHGDVIPEGVELKGRPKGLEGVDFWSEGPGHGRIVCTAVQMPVRDGPGAAVTTRNEWRTADGRKVLDEVRTLSLRDLGRARLLVMDIDLCASEGPVTFGDTKEGSFGVRVSEQITEKGKKGKLQNAEGKVGEPQVWGRKSRWCDYAGPIDGKVAGVAILDDPRNPAPAYWHSRGYGLMAANPFGRTKAGFPDAKGQGDLVKLAKGQHLKLRYGLLVHTGTAQEADVEGAYRQFAQGR